MKYQKLLSKNNQDSIIVEKCEKCGAKHDSVHANFLLYGFKICQSCKLSETLFPVYNFVDCCLVLSVPFVSFHSL